MTFYYAESPSASYYFTKTHLSRGPGFMDARSIRSPGKDSPCADGGCMWTAP